MFSTLVIPFFCSKYKTSIKKKRGEVNTKTYKNNSISSYEQHLHFSFCDLHCVNPKKKKKKKKVTKVYQNPRKFIWMQHTLTTPGPFATISASTSIIVSSTSLIIRFIWPSYACYKIKKSPVSFSASCYRTTKSNFSRTWSIPVNSRSPLNLTNTRSLSDSLIKSNGSWMPVAEEFITEIPLRRRRAWDI